MKISLQIIRLRAKFCVYIPTEETNSVMSGSYTTHCFTFIFPCNIRRGGRQEEWTGY